MQTVSFKKRIVAGVLALALFAPSWAEAINFERIVVFGTSISDSGNFYALTGEAIAAPYDELDEFLVPDAPYEKGGHHFSNGATWIEQFARRLDLNRSVRPAFAGSNPHATNYAVGGARARDGFDFNLSDQVSVFLNDFNNVAPRDALYVIDMGANDVRDALLAGSNAGVVIADALASIGANMGMLYTAGARKFLVLNVANLGVLPSIRMLDSIYPGTALAAQVLSQTFNDNLDSVVAAVETLPEAKIVRLDVFAKVNDLIANPRTYGLTEVGDACITPNLPPFTCAKPNRYLFWDGVHPTKAVHAIFAEEAADVLGK